MERKLEGIAAGIETSDGAGVTLKPDKPSRLILVSGKPLEEPIVQYGPFVMNTKEQVMQAFVDFQEGRF